ncbi:MAG: hypothetical protein ABWY04_20880 [Arthrobacter sp.]
MGEYSGAQKRSAGKPIFVEILIRGSLERVWELSQNPDLHARWDLRFSRIVPTDSDNQGLLRFRYEFWLPFHTIHGIGTSLGHRHRSDGQATSVLKFDTADPLSPIGAGSGYWRYIPTGDGLRFITGYTFRPGMGTVGEVLDARLFRPALGWATAVSFDRLRLWVEADLDPRTARSRWFADGGARAGGALLAAVLLRRALTGRHAAAAALGVSVGLASCLLPAHWSVPRAGRCLRRAPDPHAARAPAALAGLRTPSARGVERPSGGDG